MLDYFKPRYYTLISRVFQGALNLGKNLIFAYYIVANPVLDRIYY